MEDKIISALDSLTIGQTEQLLDENMKMSIGRQERSRIKNAVYAKMGSKKQTGIYISKKLAVCAAVFAIVITALAIVGIDNIAPAINRTFGFVPGHGIMDENGEIKYYLAYPVSAENDDVILQLIDAIATQDGIEFTVWVKYMAEPEQLEENADPGEGPKVVFYAGIQEFNSWRSSNIQWTYGRYDRMQLKYPVWPENIGIDMTYRAEFVDYNLTLEFELREYDFYDTLEEIGATGYNNNIAITAVPKYLEGQVQVDLYFLNDSGYAKTGFDLYRPYQNKDLHLETNSGVKSYSMPEDRFEYDRSEYRNMRLLFDVEPDDKDFILRIPYLLVRSIEKAEPDIVLPIPENEGEKVAINTKAEFKDCIIHIVDVERIPPHESPDEFSKYGDLKITLTYEYKTGNIAMMVPGLDMEPVLLEENGEYGYSCTMADDNEKGVFDTLYYSLHEGESGELRFGLKNPLYYLLDEYNLAFSR
jgi:hypothetical protein